MGLEDLVEATLAGWARSQMAFWLDSTPHDPERLAERLDALSASRSSVFLYDFSYDWVDVRRRHGKGEAGEDIYAGGGVQREALYLRLSRGVIREFGCRHRFTLASTSTTTPSLIRTFRCFRFRKEQDRLLSYCLT